MHAHADHAAMGHPEPPAPPASSSEPPAQPSVPAKPPIAARPAVRLDSEGQALGKISGTVSSTPARAAANAVVYLEDAPLVPGPTMKASVDNQRMSFAPFVQVVAVGGRVTFVNRDPFPHNVFSPGKQGFDVGTIQAQQSTARVFKTPGVLPLLCNMHPNMLAYLVVSPSSYFSKTDAKGAFAIENVPVGTYTIRAWAPQMKLESRAVTVGGGEVSVDFALQRP